MADEKAKTQNPEHAEEKGKAMGAGAAANYQGQQQPDAVRSPKPNESAGQGGGIQGTGQQQSNPGGFTGQGNLRDEDRRGDQRSEQTDQGKSKE
jgi:hypothetical protein